MTGLENRVAAGRMTSLMRQQPMALCVSLLNSVLLFLVLVGEASVPILSFWVAAIWTVTAVRGLLWMQHRGQEIAPERAASTGRRFTLLAFASGLLWGLPGILFFPENPIALQGFLVFVLGGMSAGAVATMAPHFPAFLVFVLLTLLPVIGRVLYEAPWAAREALPTSPWAPWD